MAGKKNLCAMIPAELHARIMAEKEEMKLSTLAEYVERIFTEHFEGGNDMQAERTLAVKISAELFDRLKEYAQQRIRQLMDERGWTIYRLAQESKLSQTTISNIFKRNNQPSIPTVNAICDACGITLAQFFAEDDPANTLNARSEFDNSVAVLKEDQREALAAFIKTMV